MPMLSSNTRASSTQSLEGDGPEGVDEVVWLGLRTRNLALGRGARQTVPVCGYRSVAQIGKHRERPGVEQMAKKSPAKTGLAFEQPGKRCGPCAVFCRGDEPDIVADIVCGQSECIEVSSLRGDHIGEAGKPALQSADPEGAKSTISVVDEQSLGHAPSVSEASERNTNTTVRSAASR